jgi:2-polyprenyl-3-methyl-5-hydroxy-6-metoxy-1,4-benzoquinol methylase
MRLKTELDILTATDPWQAFAEQYIALRQKEYRIPDDDTLSKLPDVPADHPHARAWKMRKKGLYALLRQMRILLPEGAQLLDIGCGNGWMANRIAEAGFQVTAIDVNLPELKQAHRVFARPGLRFAFADLFTWTPKESFDGALLASSIQYFEHPKSLFDHLFSTHQMLRTIFISDSPFYATDKKEAAAQRSREYYANLGYPEMAANYHHHSLTDLGYPYQILVKPQSAMVRRLIGGSPFSIIAVNRTV